MTVAEPGPQFLANAGIIYVSVNRYILANSERLTTYWLYAMSW